MKGRQASSRQGSSRQASNHRTRSRQGNSRQASSMHASSEAGQQQAGRPAGRPTGRQARQLPGIGMATVSPSGQHRKHAANSRHSPTSRSRRGWADREERRPGQGWADRWERRTRQEGRLGGSRRRGGTGHSLNRRPGVWSSPPRQRSRLTLVSYPALLGRKQ